MSKERPLIAVIDDEDAVRKALRRLLQSTGLAVETFSGGAEFLDSLLMHLPECAVLDLHMPGVNGFNVLARLAEMHSRVPVVVITGHDSPEAEECAISGKASAYLRKPIKDSVLLDAISAATARSAENNPPLP
jgi:FixJ family two-component response regulator